MITATRDSVCMGDDCFAPNQKALDCDQNLRLSDWLMTAVTEYLPTIHKAVWVIYSHKQIIGYLYCDDGGNYSAEPIYEDLPMNALHITEIYCRIFHKSDFKDKYPEYIDLLDIVKQYLSESI